MLMETVTCHIPRSQASPLSLCSFSKNAVREGRSRVPTRDCGFGITPLPTCGDVSGAQSRLGARGLRYFNSNRYLHIFILRKGLHVCMINITPYVWLELITVLICNAAV